MSTCMQMALMKMQQVQNVEVARWREVRLSSRWGYHVMMFDLQGRPRNGERFPA